MLIVQGFAQQLLIDGIAIVGWRFNFNFCSDLNVALLVTVIDQAMQLNRYMLASKMQLVMRMAKTLACVKCPHG